MANVTHSYAVIQAAARMVQPAFKDNPKVANLTFSLGWVQGLLDRARLRRRRVSTQIKKLPPVDVVQKRMKEIQQHISGGGFRREDIISADETGHNYAAGPNYQYVPSDADRATAPAADDKLRITVLAWGTAAGEMGPAFVIIKCSVQDADLSRTRVLQALHAMPGFTKNGGWELKGPFCPCCCKPEEKDRTKFWERVMPVSGRRGGAAPQEEKHVRPYLWNASTMEVRKKGGKGGGRNAMKKNAVKLFPPSP